jgi:hypothetical protein
MVRPAVDISSAARPPAVRIRRLFAVAAVLGAAVVSGGAIQLGDRVPGRPFDVDYRLRLAGFPIGNAALKGGVGGGQYRVDLDARLTGLAGWVTGISGSGQSQGAAAGRRVVPSVYSVDIPASDHPVAVRVGLIGGNVVNASLTPPLQERPDRVPVQEAHKKGVVDPIGALLMLHPGPGPVLDPGACNRTLPVFDGSGRFDVKLSYSATKPIKLPGYDGPAIVCAARYVPIAGHRERPSVVFMRENRDMEAWLVPVAGTRALVPVRIAVATKIGRLVIEARRFGAPAAGAPEIEPEFETETAAGPDPARNR